MMKQRISDEMLDKQIKMREQSRDFFAGECMLSFLKELKGLREADKNIKKCMIGFCDKFESKENHSTICYPPDDQECCMLDFCKSMGKILKR